MLQAIVQVPHQPLLPQPWAVLATLVVILAASWFIHSTVVRRATVRRHWLELSEWAAAHGMKLRDAHKGQLPALLLARITDAKLVCALGDQKLTLARLESAGADTKHSWNALLRAIPGPWPPTGLRPVSQSHSLLDFWRLQTLAHLSHSQRFNVISDDPTAAAILAASPLPALTPADIGLLLEDGWLILDFSSRPFDTIEDSRIHALAEQLAAHTPAPPRTNADQR